MARLFLVPLARSFRHRCMARKPRVNCRMRPHSVVHVLMFVQSKFPSQRSCAIFGVVLLKATQLLCQPSRCPSVRLLILHRWRLPKTGFIDLVRACCRSSIRSFAKLIGYQTCPILLAVGRRFVHFHHLVRDSESGGLCALLKKRNLLDDQSRTREHSSLFRAHRSISLGLRPAIYDHVSPNLGMMKSNFFLMKSRNFLVLDKNFLPLTSPLR